MEDSKLVIIGNGVAGVTAARHIRKRSNVPIIIISAESKYFFSRTALMYIYMGHMKYEHTKPYEDHFWVKNKIELIQDRVEQVNFSQKSLDLAKGGSISYTQLIIATGSSTATYSWPGLDLKGVQGLYSLQDLATMEENTSAIKKAVVIGGGLIGVEMAEMLLSRGIEVEMLVRESRFWGNVLPEEESILVKHQMEEGGVKLHFNTELDRFIGGDNNCVTAVKTKDGRQIDCQFAGVTTGVRPNISFLKNSNLEIDKGILVNEFLESNIEDVYAIGDCAQLRHPNNGRRSIEAVWYVGKMMGEVVAANICGEATPYNPSNWFNSAKFFNLEYHTYGNVAASESANESSVYWMSDSEAQFIRLAYDQASMKTIGMNSLGIRLDHRQCDAWLNNGTSIHEVIVQLEQADFNPEFHKISFKTIKRELKKQLNTPLK